jgi:hypothetical protein
VRLQVGQLFIAVYRMQRRLGRAKNNIFNQVYLMMAATRNGPPLPPAIFIGMAITKNPPASAGGSYAQRMTL